MRWFTYTAAGSVLHRDEATARKWLIDQGFTVRAKQPNEYVWLQGGEFKFASVRPGDHLDVEVSMASADFLGE